jgi:hypothetical protein
MFDLFNDDFEREAYVILNDLSKVAIISNDGQLRLHTNKDEVADSCKSLTSNNT